MSNHYPHQNRYVPSKLLPTHYYRRHHEFGIPFKRYPLNFDEHEESGYYIDFNQTHLVYAVPCTDITFSKKYNRDDLKNETIDTTAETRETVGTTAARYHNNWHSRHYPHCAHSSHVQGFDVLTITKLMDYEMQLHDVTPERLKTLFENFACPQRDTVVFEHMWMEQHKFLSMYFKVHKKPLLDYCLFRFPEPPVCPGPVPPTPGDGPHVLSVAPMTRYIDPETCVTYVDLLVTFDRNIAITGDALDSFASVNFNGTESTVLSAVPEGTGFTDTYIVTVTFDDNEGPGVVFSVFLDNIVDENDNYGSGEERFDVDLSSPYVHSLFASYQDHEFDSINNQTTVWLAFSRNVDYWEGETHITQEEVPVSFAVNNGSFIMNGASITASKPGEENLQVAMGVDANVEHDGHACARFVFPGDYSSDPTYDINFKLKAYLFKYVDPQTNETYLQNDWEQFTLQWSNLERVISNYGLMSNDQDEVTGLWLIYPCDESDIITVDLSKIHRSPYDDLETVVNPISYNLGPYRQQSELIVQSGREVYLTFEPKITFVDRYSYFIDAQAITDDSSHYNAYWAHAIPDPEPVPDQGPVLTYAYGNYTPDALLPVELQAVFDQDVEIVDTTNINVVYDDGVGFEFVSTMHNLSLQDFEAAIDELIAYPNTFTELPSSERLVDHFYDYTNSQDYILRHPDSGEVWRNSQVLTTPLPYIHNCNPEEMAFANQMYFSQSAFSDFGTLCGADMFGFGINYGSIAQPGIHQMVEDYATRNSLTLADLFDGSHMSTVAGLRYLAEMTLPHYEYWDGTDTDAQFQSHINDLYNEPLGGQTYPDDAIYATRSIVDGMATAAGITTSDLLTDPDRAVFLRQNLIEAGRTLVFIKMVTTACTEQYMNDTLYDIVMNITYDAWDYNINYFPYTNWVLPTDIEFSTSNTNLIMDFDNSNVRERSVYISVPQNALRNPVSGYSNRAGEKWTYVSTEEVIFYSPTGLYDSDSGKVLIYINTNVPIDLTGSVSDVTITDGINTANPDRITIDPNEPYQAVIEFDNANWAINQTITVDIAQGTLTNHNNPDYSNDAYAANLYVNGTPPTPPATSPTVIGTMLTHDATAQYPYQAVISFDQDVAQGASTASITDGVNTATPDNVLISGNTITLQWLEPNPDWISTSAGNITLDIPSGVVTDLTGTEGNTAYTDTNLAFSDITPSYTVTFDSDGGSAVAAQIVTSGSTATQPATPTKTNYTFVHWDLNGSEYNFSTPVTSDITLVAIWTYVPPTITVTFDSDGGSAVASQTIQAGSTPTQPANPTKSGYTFNYWKLNGVQYNFDVALSSNTTLVADWTANPQPVNPSTTVYSNQTIHTYAGTYSQTNTLHMSMSCQTSQSGTTAKYKFTGNIWAVAGPGASSTYYSDGVTVSATIAGVTATAASTGALNSSSGPVAFDTGWINVPNGVGSSAGTVTAAIKAVDSAHMTGYCNYNANVSVNKPYVQ